MKRVLVVEDNAAIRECIAEVLESEGYVVSQAGDGQEGLRKARADMPSLITLDLMMPGMNGWEFRAAQRRDPEVADIPVIVISALEAEPRSESCLGDVAAWLTKPFDVAGLLSAVSQWSASPRRATTTGRRADTVEGGK